MLAPYITSCPSQNQRIQWQNFPALNVTNAPNASVLTNETLPAISHNRTTPLSQPGNQLNLTWESPGKQVGPDLSYTTTTSAGPAKVCACPDKSSFPCSDTDVYSSTLHGSRSSILHIRHSITPVVILRLLSNLGVMSLEETVLQQ